ncbi:MAG: hypothetical protein IJN39_03190 [Clostridia bacterium]|nr:hypothetical protein [Clostridia bacterium]
MDMIKHSGGFSLALGDVSFEFDENSVPEKSNGLFELCIKGNVPVPSIIKGDRIMLPVDDGIVLTADKKCGLSVPYIKGSFCSREGTMSMVIIERSRRYLLIALDSGINSEYKTEWENGMYSLRILCHEPRKVTYGIFNSLADACKCYRGLKKNNPKTLAEKIRKIPEAKKLIGGGIFWVWGDNYDAVMYSDKNTELCPGTGDGLLSVAAKLHENGIEKAMFGLLTKDDAPYSEKLYKNFGYPCTQYDNYSDVLNPELLDVIPSNRARNCDYTARRMKDYPDGVQISEDGTLTSAWQIKGFDGKMHSQNALCPIVAAERIKTEIPEILKQFPYYKGRFLDVFGVGLSACYSKEHPLTMSQCLKVKNSAYESILDMGLITGTEDGFEDITDNLIYTEGLHSPVFFRGPDSGRTYPHTFNEKQTECIREYMLNPEHRVPLWHLVYHENMLAFPYWGDSTEMSPELISKKILFACLYGCPPLYSFCAKDFPKLQDIIISSYKKITYIHEKVAELPMTDFEILTDDYKVQKSVFGNRYEVIANFSDEKYVYENHVIEPNDLLFSGDMI